eukprot:CAMPEP_0115849252 /NCGR_PEP_ID=MMETSP0287-20121206/11353_1 /TAXON_ID=412157 /ORGANISM="Chrysochromulina rotalis, Strain UIO044" /LENGTH=660 /DNA_ID=CAMNT_0003303213 /DNA_START=76 /DNA_END=2059 /DNA_ORIENTATION=-
MEAPEASNKGRWIITSSALYLLEQVYKIENYPSLQMRQRLAMDLGVSARQVQVWFQNRRQRDRNQAKGEGEMKDSMSAMSEGTASDTAEMSAQYKALAKPKAPAGSVSVDSASDAGLGDAASTSASTCHLSVPSSPTNESSHHSGHAQQTADVVAHPPTLNLPSVPAAPSLSAAPPAASSFGGGPSFAPSVLSSGLPTSAPVTTDSNLDANAAAALPNVADYLSNLDWLQRSFIHPAAGVSQMANHARALAQAQAQSCLPSPLPAAMASSLPASTPFAAPSPYGASVSLPPVPAQPYGMSGAPPVAMNGGHMLPASTDAASLAMVYACLSSHYARAAGSSEGPAGVGGAAPCAPPTATAIPISSLDALSWPSGAAAPAVAPVAPPPLATMATATVPPVHISRFASLANRGHTGHTAPPPTYAEPSSFQMMGATTGLTGATTASTSAMNATLGGLAGLHRGQPPSSTASADVVEPVAWPITAMKRDPSLKRDPNGLSKLTQQIADLPSRTASAHPSSFASLSTLMAEQPPQKAQRPPPAPEVPFCGGALLERSGVEEEPEVEMTDAEVFGLFSNSNFDSTANLCAVADAVSDAMADIQEDTGMGFIGESAAFPHRASPEGHHAMATVSARAVHSTELDAGQFAIVRVLAHCYLTAPRHPPP